jgi:hypothetical protein
MLTYANGLNSRKVNAEQLHLGLFVQRQKTPSLPWDSLLCESTRLGGRQARSPSGTSFGRGAELRRFQTRKEPIQVSARHSELEEGTALPFQLNPFGQLISAHVLHVHLEGEAIGQLTPFLYRVSERLDELTVPRPFFRRYSVDVAGQHRRHSQYGSFEQFVGQKKT